MENAVGNITTGEIINIYSFEGLLCIGLIGVVLVFIGTSWKRYQAVLGKALASERPEWAKKYNSLIIAVNLITLFIGMIIYQVGNNGAWKNSFLWIGFAWAGAFIPELLILLILPWTNKRKGKYFPKIPGDKLVKAQLSVGSFIFLAASLTVTAVALVSITSAALDTNVLGNLTIGFSIGKDGLINGLALFLGAILFFGFDYLWDYWTSE